MQITRIINKKIPTYYEENDKREVFQTIDEISGFQILRDAQNLDENTRTNTFYEWTAKGKHKK